MFVMLQRTTMSKKLMLNTVHNYSGDALGKKNTKVDENDENHIVCAIIIFAIQSFSLNGK